MTDTKTAVADLAATEHGWPTTDIDVEPFDRLRVPSCHFFAVSHKTAPIHDAALYAVLPSGEIVSQSNDEAIDALTSACATNNLDAATWAELVARFHPTMGPGRVLLAPEPPLSDDDPPSPVTAPAQVGDRLHFFFRNTETMILYEVEARIQDGRVLAVQRNKR